MARSVELFEKVAVDSPDGLKLFVAFSERVFEFSYPLLERGHLRFVDRVAGQSADSKVRFGLVTEDGG
jgi:hypothetical protein